ncbi:MAG: TonB-dependent receptor [Bacteroidales bacterium]
MKTIPLLILLFSLGIQTTFGQYKVEGTISDAGTNEGLPGAYITTSDRSQGAISDRNSHFILESTERIDSITITFVGYKTTKFKVNSGFMNVRIEQSQNELNQVVVSAQRETQSRTSAPIAVSVLPAKVIEETKATELSALLNKVSGVLVANFGGENQSVSIRQPLSFIRTQLVTLEDEIPINPTTIASSSNLKEINMTAIKAIEVLKGPASSIYGSEAIGGTINFITKKPSLLPTAGISMQANDMGYKRLDFEASGTSHQLGVYAGGYAATCSDNYRDYCDFRKIAGLIKGVYKFSDKVLLTTTLNYIHHNVNLSGSLDSTIFYTNDKYNQYTFCYSDFASIRASVRLDNEWNENDKTFFTLHFRNSYEDQIPTYYIQRIYGGPPPARYKGEYIESGYRSYGLLIQHRHKFNFLNAQLIAGVSADLTPFTYISRAIDVTKEGDLYTSYKTTDTYVQDFNADLFNSAEYLVFEISPARKLKLTSALRYDRLDYNYRNNLPSTAISGAPDDKNTFDHLSPKLGINYNLSGKMGLYGNYSEGFAPPMFSQLYKAVIVPVLKPASYNNYEIGGWLSFNKNKGYLDVSAYHSDGINEIVSVLLGDGTSQNQSTGKTRHEGIEYSVRYTFFDQIEVRLNAANSIHKFLQYVYQDKDYSGNYMSLAPKFVANSELTWRPSFIKDFRIGVEWEKIGKYWVDELNTRKYDGYSLFNLRTGYKIGGLNIWLNILNLSNDLYAVRVQRSSYGAQAVTYVPGTRRSIFFGAEYNIGGKKRQ